MPSSDLHYLGAVDAVRMFHSRELSPVELMNAVIARAEAVAARLNPFSQTFFDEARDQAKKAEARYGRGGRTRSLEGLPLAVKDEETIKGLPATSGSTAFRNVTGEETTPIVERCFNAGAVMHVRTTTPEFSCAGVCYTRHWGVTRNPWNTDYTPGGSSGGSGATLAAGGLSPRHRLGHCRIDPHSRELFRRGRLQAPLRTESADPYLQSRHLLPFGAHGAFCCRLCPLAERHGRPPPPGYRHIEAKTASSPRLCTGQGHAHRPFHRPGVLRG